ncbi:MAG TPA: hypothetical protein PLC52_06325 [Anaerolineales bacterium]|nr:hypothetical protein [Anaerolineales bacterium]HRQ92464.1 hypothetical protein [Anaerolineales bacterium]
MMPSPLAILALVVALMLLFSVWKGGKRRTLRNIPALQRLQRSIELSVEDGSRLQVNLGHGGILSTHSAAALAGLTLLQQVAEVAADSDLPPVATSGEGTLMLLAQDTLRSTYRRIGIADQFNLHLAQTTGTTPFAYAAGTLPSVLDRTALSTAMLGEFGPEAGLIADAAHRSEGFSIGGSPSLSTQAVLFAAAHEPLLGEELYAAGAYTKASKMHEASLRTQDVLRWVLILLLLFTAISPLLGGSE